MAQQHPNTQDFRQLQQDIKCPATPSEDNNQSPNTQKYTNTLPEYHSVGCPCPKHRLSHRALTQLAEVSHDTIKHQNDEVAQAVYRGLQKLGLELSDSEAERIAKNDTGMMPMERFLEEACDLKYIAGVDANTDGEVAKKPEERKE